MKEKIPENYKQQLTTIIIMMRLARSRYAPLWRRRCFLVKKKSIIKFKNCKALTEKAPKDVMLDAKTIVRLCCYPFL